MTFQPGRLMLVGYRPTRGSLALSGIAACPRLPGFLEPPLLRNHYSRHRCASRPSELPESAPEAPTATSEICSLEYILIGCVIDEVGKVKLKSAR